MSSIHIRLRRFQQKCLTQKQNEWMADVCPVSNSNDISYMILLPNVCNTEMYHIRTDRYIVLIKTLRSGRALQLQIGEWYSASSQSEEFQFRFHTL